MSRIPAIRAAILATLATVQDVGRTHGFERYAADRTRMRTLYVATIAGAEQLRGWFVRRRSFTSTRTGATRRTITTTWEVVGYMAIADEAETELDFDALIDAIAQVFHDNPDLSGAVTTTIFDDGAGVTLVDSAPVMFAGVLCHAATLRLQTRHTE